MGFLIMGVIGYVVKLSTIQWIGGPTLDSETDELAQSISP